MQTTFHPCRLATNLLVILLLAAAQPSHAQLTPASQSPTFVVQPYLQYGLQKEITIMWETDRPMTSRVYYGPARFGADKPELDRMQEIPGSRTQHEITLRGLRPNTRYFYQVLSTQPGGKVLRSEIYSFKTAVPEDGPFAFGLVGDSQDNPEVWGQISSAVWMERPDFVLHAGDLVGTGARKADWTEEFFPPGHELMSRVPVFSVLGNHEGDAGHYYRYFHNPQPEYYYSFHYGNAKFILLDSNRPLERGSQQYNWLEWELASNTAEWTFVMHHHPCYSSDENDYGDTWKALSKQGDPAVQDVIELYERYRVDLVFAGHIHNYERTHPLANGQVDQKNGVRYLVVGGAGGGLENWAPTRSWFTAKLRNAHHYGMFTVHQNYLSFQAYDLEGRLFDQFELRKPARTLRSPQAYAPPAPVFRPRGRKFLDSIRVELRTAFPEARIHYTKDGSTPTPASPQYTTPLLLTRSTELNIRAFWPNGKGSRTNTATFTRVEPQAGVDPGRLKPGLEVAYYTGAWKQLPNFRDLKPLRMGVAQQVALDVLETAEDHWAYRFTGYLKVDSTGLYQFYTTSDDGTKLLLHGQEVVNNDGSHSAITKMGRIALEAGYHPLEIQYFEDYGGVALDVGFVLPDKRRRSFNNLKQILFRSAE